MSIEQQTATDELDRKYDELGRIYEAAKDEGKDDLAEAALASWQDVEDIAMRLDSVEAAAVEVIRRAHEAGFE